MRERDTERPALRIRNSSSANSRGLRSTTRSPCVTRRVSVSSVKSPTLRVASWCRSSRSSATRSICTRAKPTAAESRCGVPDHGFQILGGSPPALLLQVLHVRREERSQERTRSDLERRQLFLGGGVGVQGDHGAGVEPVEGVRRVTTEQPDMSGLAEVARETREIAVRIRDQRRDQGTVLEMLAQGEHQLVILEIGEKHFQRRVCSAQERLDGGVVVLAPAA